MRSFVRTIALPSTAIVAAAAVLLAQRPAVPDRTAGATAAVTARIVTAAQAVLGTLDGSRNAKVQYPFDSSQKTRWSNLPSPMFERTGIRLGDLSEPQRAAVMTLLAVALSGTGYQKVLDIMRGDEVLRTGDAGAGRRGPAPGGGRGPGRGPAFGQDEYYLAFVGTPSNDAPWMLQFGGHHLAINLTLTGSQATMAPSLPAAQPATYTVEGRTVRPLGRENDKAFALVNALDAGQRGRAVLDYRVADLVLGPGKDGQPIQPEGIRATALSPAQQTMLWELVREWVGIMNDAFAEPRMAEIKADPANIYFAWSGPTTNGGAAYFRVQGPTLVIEYAPQGSVDHIHTIYRDPTNDYGAKFARR